MITLCFFAKIELFILQNSILSPFVLKGDLTMIVYESIKEEFLQDVFDDQLTTNIINNFNQKIGKVNRAEVRSWDNSMQYMYRVLMDEAIPNDSGVAIEFNIPYSSKRVDFIITGMNAEKESVVIVELKQWEEVEKIVGKEAIVKTYLGGGIRETPHPSYQAWSYASLIRDYNENVQNENINLYPCAYLHNYIMQKPDDLTDKVYEYYIEDAPVFVKGDAKKLRDFIKQHIKYGDNKEALYKIERGKIRPSKSLQDSLSLMLKGNEEFIMIDEQKVVFEEALALSKKSLKTGRKQVLIVEGGPGTGKSVVGINLLVKLTKEELVVQYVTKNAAPRHIYEQKLKGDYRKSEISNLFKGSGSYTETKNNEFDVLVIDEAHRLNEKSGMFKNMGEHQVKELIKSSKLAIFFIDINQKIHIDDVGDIDVINKYADELKCEVTSLELTSQFRCNGSDGYLAWLDDVLVIRETANVNFIGKDYDFRVYDNPNEMRAEIVKLNEGRNKSRIVSGYCWSWNKDTRIDSDIPDIVIPEFDFGMSWNLNNTETWAIDEESVKESGVIHTCQGLEFDYVGVIIGDDLRYINNQVITDQTKRATTDRSLWGIKKMYKENPEKATKIADQVIRNTYRTLMTRGQKGCFIYCTDKDLAAYFKKRLKRMQDYTKEEFFTAELSVAERNEEYRS